MIIREYLGEKNREIVEGGRGAASLATASAIIDNTVTKNVREGKLHSHSPAPIPWLSFYQVHLFLSLLAIKQIFSHAP
jgi:hypothetical protein